MTPSAAVVGCTFAGCCESALTTLSFPTDPVVLRIQYCEEHLAMMTSSPFWDGYVVHHGAVLQPRHATPEQVVCTEVMCHAFALLGAP